jgi:hypothetical protein
MTPPNRLGPDATSAEAETIQIRNCTRHPNRAAADVDVVDKACPCADDAVPCSFYNDWLSRPAPSAHTAECLRRRRAAARRCPRLESGRRDPLSAVMW